MSEESQERVRSLLVRPVIKGMGVCKLETVKLDSLNCFNEDEGYQRPEKPNLIKDIVENFDEISFGIPIIGRRSDGSLWIVDAQQRICGIRILGWTEVEAWVFDSDGSSHEARVYEIINGKRVQTGTVDTFKSMLHRGDYKAVAIQKACDDCGLDLKARRGRARGKWPGISCIGTLIMIYNKGGKELLYDTFDLISDAWGDIDEVRDTALQDNVVKGMAWFIHKTRNLNVDRRTLILKLKNITPHKLLYTDHHWARGKSKACRIAHNIGAEYNSGKRSRMIDFPKFRQW